MTQAMNGQLDFFGNEVLNLPEPAAATPEPTKPAQVQGELFAMAKRTKGTAAFAYAEPGLDGSLFA